MPCGIEDGVTDVIVGNGLGAEIVNGRELEGPPPGEGFVTDICTVPGVAIADAGTMACKQVWSGHAKLAFNADPLKLSTAFPAICAPAASITSGMMLPATAAFGFRLLIVGTG
jgi:hypothetical protein